MTSLRRPPLEESDMEESSMDNDVSGFLERLGITGSPASGSFTTSATASNSITPSVWGEP